MKQTNTTFIQSLSGFRRPTPAEHEAVLRVMSNRFASSIRLTRTMSTALTVFGVVMLFSVGSGGVLCIVLGLASFVGVFAAINSKNTENACLRAFQNGDYNVLDGTVCELGHTSVRNGFTDVRFLSCHGQRADGWFSVRKEGLAQDIPALLVYASNVPIKGGIHWVFTPFMMSEQAERIRW